MAAIETLPKTATKRPILICGGIEVAVTQMIRNHLTVNPLCGLESNLLSQTVDKKVQAKSPRFCPDVPNSPFPS